MTFVRPRTYVQGPGTFTLYPSAQSGTIMSSSITAAAAAQAGGTLSPSVGMEYYAGQQFYPGDTYAPVVWYCFESFLDFNTSGVVGTIVSATLSVGLTYDFSSVDFTVQARVHDWGVALTAGDWVAGAALGSKTLVATLASAGIGAVDSYKAMTESGSALRSAVNQAGTTRFILCSDRHASGVDFTGNDELLVFHRYSNGLLKPKLVVVTT